MYYLTKSPTGQFLSVEERIKALKNKNKNEIDEVEEVEEEEKNVDIKEIRDKHKPQYIAGK